LHQPEYFPWLGFFDKLRQVDLFVLYDTVQFNRESMQHRTRLWNPHNNSPYWLTIPYNHEGELESREIQHLTVHRPETETSKPLSHPSIIRSFYGKRTPPWWIDIESSVPWASDSVSEIAEDSIKACARLMGISTPIVRLSRFPKAIPSADMEKTEKIIHVCKYFSASMYISGKSGGTYLDLEAMSKSYIIPQIQNFNVAKFPENMIVREGVTLSCLHWMFKSWVLAQKKS